MIARKHHIKGILMSKYIGYAIAVAFGLIVAGAILFIVGETIDTVAQYREDVSRSDQK